MKQFYLMCILLLASLATFGRDVTVHVTDQRGAAVSGLPVQFDNESFDTDVNGDFVIKGLGSSNSGEVDLEEEQGVVTIAPKDGKYKVSLGNIRGYGGAAVENATINGFAAEEFPDFYCAPGNYSMMFEAPGYFPYIVTYQVIDEDVTVDIDLSQSRALRFLFTDCDGTAMENLSVDLRSADNPRLDVDLATDASGFCEIYVMPGDYDYDPDYEKPFYPPETKSIQVSDEDVVEDVNLVGTTLLTVRLKNTKEIGTSNAKRILSRSSRLHYNGGGWDAFPRSGTEDGDDIVYGVLIEKEYTNASMSLLFSNTTKDILGVQEDNIVLDGKDVNFEYDFGTYLTAKLTAPDGYLFSGEAEIDGVEVSLDKDAVHDMLMPPGEHHWAVGLQTADGQQTLPFGKEQSFDLEEDESPVVYAFNENDYYGIKFFVKDENGCPANGFPVTLRQVDYDYEISSQTDADGCCTVLLLEPGYYSYEVGGNWAHGDSVYLPISKGVLVGEGMLQETVSFEGYKRLSLKVKGIGIYDEWNTSLPTVKVKGVDDFPMALDESASTVEYAGSMMMPQGDYSGTVGVRDLDGHKGSVDFSVKLKENDVAETIDFSAYRAVDFTVNQEELVGSVVYVFKEGQKIEQQDGVNGDRLLPPGKYTAFYGGYQYCFMDTLYFEIADKAVKVDFQFNPEDFRAVTFEMVNQPEQVRFIEILVDSMRAPRNQESIMFRKGKHYYEFSFVSVGENYHHLWPLEGTFEVGDEDKVVEVDLSQYRVFQLRLVMPDNSGVAYDVYPMYLSKGGETLVLSYVNAYYDGNTYALPVGTYDLEVKGNEEEWYYGTLTVGADCPDEITVQLSDKSNAISDAQADNSDLSVTMKNGRISVVSARSEEVEVCVYDLDGRVLWQGNVMPGSMTDTGLCGQGIYLINMKQESCARTQKLIVR